MFYLGTQTCEARLFQFTGVANGEGERPVPLSAGSNQKMIVHFLEQQMVGSLAAAASFPRRGLPGVSVGPGWLDALVFEVIS